MSTADVVGRSDVKTIPVPKTAQFYSQLRKRLEKAALECRRDPDGEQTWFAVSLAMSDVMEYGLLVDEVNHGLSIAEGDCVGPRVRGTLYAGETWHGVSISTAGGGRSEQLKRAVVNAVREGAVEEDEFLDSRPQWVPRSHVVSAINYLVGLGAVKRRPWRRGKVTGVKLEKGWRWL